MHRFDAAARAPVVRCVCSACRRRERARRPGSYDRIDRQARDHEDQEVCHEGRRHRRGTGAAGHGRSASDMGRRPRARRRAAVEERVQVARRGGGRAHARRARRLRPADRRRARHAQRRDSLRRRRRHRVPHEDDGAGSARRHADAPAGSTRERDRSRDALRRGRDVQGAAPARRARRRLERVERDGRPEGPRVGATGDEWKREPLRRVRRVVRPRRRCGPAVRPVPRAAQPLRQPRLRRADRAALQPPRAQAAPRASTGTGEPRLARPVV